MAIRTNPAPLERGLALLAVMAPTATLLLAACGPGPAAPPAPAAAPGPQPGGTLVFSGRYGVETLHPFKVSGSPVQRSVGLVYETLVGVKLEREKDYRIEFEVVPRLAEGWEQPDPSTYVLLIRKGVKWHDGQPFTADDVLFTRDWINQERYPPADAYKGVSRIEKLDDYTVRVSLKQPSASFLDGLAGPVAYMAPKHLADRGEDLSKVAVGTGPFKLKTFDRTKESVFSRNADYWQQGKPYVDEIRELWGLDEAAETATFVAGQSDLLALLNRGQAETLLKVRPEALYDVRPADNGVSVVMQLGKPPFEDIRVRRALHLAIDRQAMVKTLTGGDGAINPPGIQGWRTGWAIPQEELLKLPGYRQPKDQDIAEGKRLLAEAGYPSGFKFTIPQSKDGPVGLPISEVVQAHFRSIGVEMDIALQDGASFTKRDKEGDFDAEVWVNFNSRDVSRVAQRYHSKGPLNKIGLNDPKLDQLLDAIPATLDVANRKQATIDLQRYLLEKLYFIPTIELALYDVRQPWVQDFRGLSIPIMTVDHSNAPYVWLDRGKLPPDRR